MGDGGRRTYIGIEEYGNKRRRVGMWKSRKMIKNKKCRSL